MIPRAHITAWRDTVPWATDAQVEQDLVISRALVDLYSDDLLARELAFRGGTAQQKLHFDPPARYSEDIDLVQVNPGPIGPALQAMRSCLDPWLGEPRWKQSQGRATFVYRFESEAKPVTPLKLKVEINTREHFTVFGLRPVRFVVGNPWYRGEADLLTYGPEELLGTKVRALYQRKKGRDLFDLSEALSSMPGLDTQAVVDCFLRYMEHDGLRVTRTQFELNLAQKMDDDVFLRDVQPLLASGTSWNPRRALKLVQRDLISKLPEGAARSRRTDRP
jgi:predicted nucleotidyltransferase component of viral defense system